MEPVFDIPDSTDWLSTPLSGLSRVESALRCQVCKDLFKNPVTTSCCHTFCSICIRRCLSADGKCPTCRADDQAVKLRQNWAVDEVVDSFRQVRGDLLGFARNLSAGPNSDSREARIPKKRRIEEMQDATSQENGRSPPKTRSQSAWRNNGALSTSSTPMVIDNSEDDDYQPDDGLVACPICNRRMKEEAVFPHLNRCPGPSSQKEPQPNRPRKTPSSNKPPERLPTINYSVMKDTDMRRKLRELGIPEFGPRLLLQKRHTEWLNLWNANCDSKSPRSKQELLRELDIWEQTQGIRSRDQTNSIMKKDFDGAAWSAAHGDDFRKLIESAQKKRESRVAPASESLPASKQLSTETADPQDPQIGDSNAPGNESPDKIDHHTPADSGPDSQPGMEGGSQRIVVEDTTA
ncbi:postreplication repair protein, putative [Coccidioides posadasii C735 delta SOWgp]|uniref:Postreplication repair E3 ubiquitin-protein ligase RAD18 n=1 Tax=Coccidioides posadasii (strain C735) TaxID=222929 RepID=C5PDQ9_COCP7|nr:postreplication repair protein, putative [Coccidioides posadasii C735 delta SOWgp]EER25220.1 postreplication repair protein, putative [Coccidioides posadasii C735 delta SOWgp]|eukprot:XP_003067365.1 postreplication repair protein, putative [Coccidioides posadasii C735 delta SOWgp]